MPTESLESTVQMGERENKILLDISAQTTPKESPRYMKFRNNFRDL